MESLHEDALCLANDIPAQEGLLEACNLVGQLLDNCSEIIPISSVLHPPLRPVLAPDNAIFAVAPPCVKPPPNPTRVGNGGGLCLWPQLLLTPAGKVPAGPGGAGDASEPTGVPRQAAVR